MTTFYTITQKNSNRFAWLNATVPLHPNETTASLGWLHPIQLDRFIRLILNDEPFQLFQSFQTNKY